MNEVPDKKILEDAATELNIDPSFIEKDWYVTQLIAEMTHFGFMDAQIIFTGGTALAKAHRLIKRFSEDTDFRLVSDTIHSFSKSQQRVTLSELRKSILKHLQSKFSIDEALIKSRNDNRFMSFDINYPTVFNRSQSLRPHILVEFTFTTMVISPIQLSVSSLVNELLNYPPEVTSIFCTDPIENACDKLSALIWRVADRDRNSVDDDASIVRHLHDLASMGESVITYPQFRQLAIETIQNDDNRSDKIKGLGLAQKISGLMNILKEDKAYAREYEVFVKGMSYGTARLQDFNQAVILLENLTRILL